MTTLKELDKLNKLFINRYTDEDIQMYKPRSTSPPIIDDWYQNKNSYRNQRYYHSNNQYQYRRDRSRSPSRYYYKRR